MMHDLTAFVLHLHLFLRVTRRKEGIDVRQDVESNLVGIHFLRHGLSRDDFADLTFQFFDGLRACAGHSLIAGGKDPLHVERLMQRVESHQSDGGGAIRIGDDAAMLLHVARVNLGNDQRHRVIHAERAGIIHHHATRPGGNRAKLLRDAPTGAEERNVDARKAVLRQFRHRHVFALEFELLADRPGGREQGQLPNGKLAFLKGLDHFDADGSRRTDYGYMRITIHSQRPASIATNGDVSNSRQAGHPSRPLVPVNIDPWVNPNLATKTTSGYAVWRLALCTSFGEHSPFRCSFLDTGFGSGLHFCKKMELESLVKLMPRCVPKDSFKTPLKRWT